MFINVIKYQIKMSYLCSNFINTSNSFFKMNNIKSFEGLLDLPLFVLRHLQIKLLKKIDDESIGGKLNAS